MSSVADDVKRLSDPQQSVRDAAAAVLRATIARDAGATGDPGEAFWKNKLSAIKPGITDAQFRSATGATSEGAVSSGQSTSAIYRLDDYWIVAVYFDHPDKLREVGALERRARAVWVEPPKGFSGKWVTYFVNGVVDMHHTVPGRAKWHSLSLEEAGASWRKVSLANGFMPWCPSARSPVGPRSHTPSRGRAVRMAPRARPRRSA